MQTKRSITLTASLLALCVVPVAASFVRLAGLMQGHASPENARFFESPMPITLHLLAVIPYSVLGALQFVPALRRRGWHRASGMWLVPLGLITALTGLWMTLSYPWPKGDGEAVYLMRLIVGVVMTYSIVRGVASLGRRDYVAHGAWMLRGYAIGMGAATHVFTHLPWFVLADGPPGEAPRAVMMGLGWIINAAVAEYVIRRRRSAPARVSAGRARSAVGSAI